MTTRPLTERQEKVLVILLGCRKGYGMTGNEIGMKLRLPPARRARGPWSGPMGPAQRVIGTINGLTTRGLVTFAERTDGLSGSATRLTEAGEKKARELERNGVHP